MKTAILVSAYIPSVSVPIFYLLSSVVQLSFFCVPSSIFSLPYFIFRLISSAVSRLSASVFHLSSCVSRLSSSFDHLLSFVCRLQSSIIHYLFSIVRLPMYFTVGSPDFHPDVISHHFLACVVINQHQLY